VRKINSKNVEEVWWRSPGGKFEGAGKQLSEALGRKPASTDMKERHPFDVEIARIAPGATPYPYHMHSAQWEFYHVISGEGTVRHEGGMRSKLVTRSSSNHVNRTNSSTPANAISSSTLSLITRWANRITFPIAKSGPSARPSIA
jgi:uncharacterized cupin superfamily protein